MNRKFLFSTLLFRWVVGEGFTPPVQSFDENDWDFRRKYIIIAFRRCNFGKTKLPGGVNPSPTVEFRETKIYRTFG